MMSSRGKPMWGNGGRRWLAMGVLLALVACGGGSENQAGVGSGGTGSYSSGSISAFGSIVVNGEHHDHTRAAISYVRADGSSATWRAADLKLGMTIEVDEAPATQVNGMLQAGALTMRVRSDLIGPVTDLDPAAGTFKVLGQVVHVQPGMGLSNAGGTQYGDETGVVYNEPFSSMLRNGDVVEVYGHQDVSRGQGEYIATRIERKAANTVSHYVVRGVVKDLNLATGTCTIGTARIAYLDAGELPAGLANGRVARVRMLANEPSGNVYTGQGVSLTAALPSDRPNAVLAGLVTWRADGDVRQFELNGIRVDASPAHCSGCVMPQPGQRLRAQGDLVNGVLQATSLRTITELP